MPGNRNIDRPLCFEFDEVLDDFDPKEFINDVTESSKVILGTVGMPSIVELAKKLRDAGLSTELKKYQLEGVYWLWEQFCGRGRQFSSSLVSNGLAEAAPWFKLVTDPHESAKFYGSIFFRMSFLGPSPHCAMSKPTSLSPAFFQTNLDWEDVNMSIPGCTGQGNPLPQNHSHKSSTEQLKTMIKNGRIRDSQGCLWGRLILAKILASSSAILAAAGVISLAQG